MNLKLYRKHRFVLTKDFEDLKEGQSFAGQISDGYVTLDTDVPWETKIYRVPWDAVEEEITEITETLLYRGPLGGYRE